MDELLKWLQESLLLGLPNWVWVAIGAVVVILLIVLIVALAKGGKKKQPKQHRQVDNVPTKSQPVEVSTEQSALNYANFDGTYFAKQGAKIVVNDRTVWLVAVDGSTEAVNAADDTAPQQGGEKIYIVRREIVARVVKVGDDFQRVEREEVKYLAINFINRAEVRIGETIYQR